MSWSPQQEAAIATVARWLRAPVGRGGADQVMYVAGYAGTGKTTIARALSESVRKGVLYGAFTGKAALVLRKKGCEGASTIHSMIYRVDEENEDSHGGAPSFMLNEFSEVRNVGLVVIDECSMVDEQLGRDLLSFGTKVLVLGDPAQLPPVSGAGFFTAGKPDVMLTEVHRQAAENPIIRMSMDVREGGALKLGTYGESRVITRSELDRKDVLSADQLIVGMNRTRRNFNARIRQLRGFASPTPEAGERLICLKNNREKQLFNGGLWNVAELKRSPNVGRVRMKVFSEDEPAAKPRTITVLEEFFDPKSDAAQIEYARKKGTDEFTFGYVITCHKSQGSQWDDVLVFDEAATFREDARRWRYTAITRAAERVTVVQ